MISIILNFVISAISFLVGLLPTGNLPSSFFDGATYLGGVFRSFDFIVPVNIIFFLVLFAFTFELAYLTFRFILWLIHLIRGN